MATTTPYALGPRYRWQTPDAAIRDAVLRSPLRVRGIDYSGPREGSWWAHERAVEAYTVVVAALGHEHVEDQKILVAYALGSSYRQIARAMHRSDWWVRRRHRAAWERVRAMLVGHGLIPP